jgi:octaprenyl-diphosphate synthase
MNQLQKVTSKIMTENIIKLEKEKIKQYIKNDLISCVNFINDVNEYSFANSGKLIRPLLTIATAKAFNYGNDEILYKLATMIEYIHTATLLHDDVVDDSDLRRGLATVKKQFNNQTAVLVGDFIYTRAFQLMLVGNSLDIMKIMADVTNRISEGEIIQLISIGSQNFSLEHYLQIIDAKTANLFVAAVNIACILVQVNNEQNTLLSTFARNLGILFQMVDDLIDYNSSAHEMGKNTGDDMKTGKITLPIINAINKADNYDKEQIINILNNNKDNIDQRVQQMNIIFAKYHIIDDCKYTIEQYYNQAYNSLELLIENSTLNLNYDYIELLRHMLLTCMHRIS